MSLRTRLLLAQVPLALGLLVIGIVAVMTVGEMGRSGQAILADNYRSVLAAQRMKESLEHLDNGALLRIVGDQSELENLRRRFETDLKSQEANITESGEAEATAQLRKNWERTADELDSFLLPMGREELKARYQEGLADSLRDTKAKTDEILILNQDAIVRKSEAQKRHSERMNTLMILSVLGAFGIAVLASTQLTNRALRPVGILSQAVRRLGEGDLKARAQVEGARELVQLATDFNAMARKLQDFRESSLGELIQAQQLSQAAIDSLPDPVVVFGTDGTILNVNVAAEPLLGLAMPAQGEPLRNAPAEIREVLERVRGHVLSGKGPYIPRGYEEAVRVDGREGPVFLLPRASSVYSEDSGIVGATVILQDVTRLKRFDELKNDLVATVAHEFRTPLTSLRMAIHLCLEKMAGPITEKQADLLQAAREDCERLQRIVDDLLDLSRMQSGRIAIETKPVNVRAFVEEVLSHHRMSAEQRGVKLSSMVQPQLETLEVDAERLALALDNLIANGIRHTPENGAVELRALVSKEGATLEVRDTGSGIPEDQQRRIFEKFYRVPGRPGGGAGLGLSIAREIVHAHGGDIVVASKEGEGSRFTIQLPGRAKARA